MDESTKKYAGHFRWAKISTAAICPGRQSLKFTGKLQAAGKERMEFRPAGAVDRLRPQAL